MAGNFFMSILMVAAGAVMLVLGQPYGLQLIIGGVLSAVGQMMMKNETASEERDSPTYGFTQFKNPVRGDSPISVVYSTLGHKIAPTWIQAFVTPRGHVNDQDFAKIQRSQGQAISGLLAISEGPIEEIYDIRLNDEPVFRQVTDEVLATGDGSKKTFRLTAPSIDYFSLRVTLGTTFYGFDLTQKSTRLAVGDGRTSLYSFELNDRICESRPVRFYSANPQRADKEIYEYDPELPDSTLQGVLPRAWLVSKHRLLVNTQTPMTLNRELWIEWYEWGTLPGLTIKRDPDTNDVLLTFSTAPTKGTKITVSYQRRAIAGVNVQVRYGTEHQLPIWGFDSIRNSQAVGQKLVQNTYITKDTTQECDDIVFDFASGSGGFTAWDDEGEHGFVAGRFQLEMKLQTAIAGNIYSTWQPIQDPTGKLTKRGTKPVTHFEIWGDSTSQLFWSFSVRGMLEVVADRDPTDSVRQKKLTDFVRAKYSIRAIRVSENKADNNTQYADEIDWTTFQEVTNESLGYPGTALLAFHGVASEKLNGSAPNVTCRVRGINQVKTWNGTKWVMNTDATAQGNRVWAMVNLITNKRYGSGEHYTLSNIDTTSAKLVADWLDEMVYKGPNTSETEQRSLLDIVLDSRRPLLDHLRDISLPGRIWVVMRGNQFFFVKDDRIVKSACESVIAYRRGVGNTKKATLVWVHDEIATRPTELQVTYLSRTLKFEQHQVWISQPATSVEPRRIVRINAFGTVRETEVTRYARFVYAQLRRNGVLTTVGVTPIAMDFSAGQVLHVICDRTSADLYTRIRGMSFNSGGFFVRVDGKAYDDRDFATAYDKVQITTTGATQAKSTLLPVKTPSSASSPGAASATRVS